MTRIDSVWSEGEIHVEVESVDLHSHLFFDRYRFEYVLRIRKGTLSTANGETNIDLAKWELHIWGNILATGDRDELKKDIMSHDLSHFFKITFPDNPHAPYFHLWQSRLYVSDQLTSYDAWKKANQREAYLVGLLLESWVRDVKKEKT